MLTILFFLTLFLAKVALLLVGIGFLLLAFFSYHYAITTQFAPATEPLTTADILIIIGLLGAAPLVGIGLIYLALHLLHVL